MLGLVASLRCRSVRMCCHSSLSSNCLLTIRPRSWPSPTVAIEGHSKVMAVAKGRLTRLPSGCSSAIEPSHRNASVGLSLQCPSAMMQSRWRRAMDRPPRSQEPSVLRDCHVHEAMTPRDKPCDIAVGRGAVITSTTTRCDTMLIHDTTPRLIQQMIQLYNDTCLYRYNIQTCTCGQRHVSIHHFDTLYNVV